MITKAKEQTEKLEREPQQLADSRLKAWQSYESIPMPSLHDEQWRHTDLSALDLAGFTKDACVTEGIDEEASVSLSQDAKDKGVIATTLASAYQKHPELVQPYIEALQPKAFEQDKFFMLNLALFDKSVFIYVPPNVKFEDPLVITFGSQNSFPRLVVAAGESSEFKLINTFLARDPFVSAVVQLAIGSNANVSYLEIQDFEDQTTAITRVVHQLSADARFSCLTVATGGAKVRSDIITELKSPGACAKVLGIVLGSDNEHFDFNTIVEHEAPSTTSDINFRVALQDTSSSVYQGTIKVDKQAQRTVAYQSNKNLLLSDKAHAASIPKLEILANDVKCSHGATVAAVDKEQLFYLSSRGLDQTLAEQLIVGGFLNQVIESLNWAEIIPQLESRLDKKLARIKAGSKQS
jgi:Fe-S cluster assembly protein SufD